MKCHTEFFGGKVWSLVIACIYSTCIVEFKISAYPEMQFNLVIFYEAQLMYLEKYKLQDIRNEN